LLNIKSFSSLQVTGIKKAMSFLQKYNYSGIYGRLQKNIPIPSNGKKRFKRLHQSFNLK